MRALFVLVAATLLMASLGSPVPGQGKEARMASEARITMAQARQSAIARVPGNIEEGRLEREKGKLWYEFEIHKSGSGAETVIHIDAITGDVGEVEDEARSGSARENEMFGRAKISWDDAERSALSRVAGTVVVAKMERERGKLLYEFEIISGGKEEMVHVDAVTGEIESTGKK
jgi:uncharacterized membrane protein YkoI